MHDPCQISFVAADVAAQEEDEGDLHDSPPQEGPYFGSAYPQSVSSAQPATTSSNQHLQCEGSEPLPQSTLQRHSARLQGASDATIDPLRERSEHLNVGRASVPHDQPHWQDDYATNWDRVGMNRHASTSDATATAMQQLSGHAALDQDSESGVKPGKSKVWACRLCTYAENPSHSIRCEVCDTTRGSTLQDVQHNRSTSNFGPEGIGTKLGLQHAAKVLSSDSQPLKRPASSGTHMAMPSTAEPWQPPVIGRTSRPKASGKRAQQSMSSFLDAGKSAKRAAVQTIMSNRSSSDAVFTEAKWQCHRCKQWFQLGEQAEHHDYHVALDLHKSAGADHQSVKTNVNMCNH